MMKVDVLHSTGANRRRAKIDAYCKILPKSHPCSGEKTRDGSDQRPLSLSSVPPHLLIEAMENPPKDWTNVHRSACSALSLASADGHRISYSARALLCPSWIFQSDILLFMWSNLMLLIFLRDRVAVRPLRQIHSWRWAFRQAEVY